MARSRIPSTSRSSGAASSFSICSMVMALGSRLPWRGVRISVIGLLSASPRRSAHLKRRDLPCHGGRGVVLPAQVLEERADQVCIGVDDRFGDAVR